MKKNAASLITSVPLCEQRELMVEKKPEVPLADSELDSQTKEREIKR
jgi:hypothetical protein